MRRKLTLRLCEINYWDGGAGLPLAKRSIYDVKRMEIAYTRTTTELS